ISNGMLEQGQTMANPPGNEAFLTQYHGIEPGFFRLFSIPVLAGRDFTRNDVRGSEGVVVVSQDLADKYYGGEALGKMIDVHGVGDAVRPARIVGVVGATYQMGPLQPRQPVLYVPLAQVPEPMMALFRTLEPLRVALRGHGNMADWRAGIRQALAEVAPEQPIANLRSLRSIVRATTATARLSLWLIGLFAALALLLAAAGLYAVMAVAVAAREREFGVRMALGAAPWRLLQLVMRGGLGQIAVGLAIGVAAALAASHAVAVLLMTLLGQQRLRSGGGVGCLRGARHSRPARLPVAGLACGARRADARLAGRVTMIVRELCQAWRRLAKRPGYALLSVAVLGAGLGGGRERLVFGALLPLLRALRVDPAVALRYE